MPADSGGIGRRKKRIRKWEGNLTREMIWIKTIQNIGIKDKRSILIQSKNNSTGIVRSMICVRGGNDKRKIIVSNKILYFPTRRITPTTIPQRMSRIKITSQQDVKIRFLNISKIVKWEGKVPKNKHKNVSNIKHSSPKLLISST